MAKAKKKAKASIRQAVRAIGFDFSAGYLIQTEFEASGGVTYDREYVSEETTEVADRKVLRAKFVTEKKIDDVELHRDSRSIVSRAFYLMKSKCAHTPIGYFADAPMLEELEKAFDEVRETAREFNQLAASIGSDRRVRVEIYPLDVAPSNEGVARRLANLVRERLVGLRDALRAGNLKAHKEAAKRARNLEKLATGVQRDSIRFALECAATARAELGAALKEDEDASPAVAAKRGALLDVEAIEASIDMFTMPEGEMAEAQENAEDAA